jgi:purine-nucleoside phosphorylase
VAGALGGREVVTLAGRFHLYEGHAAPLAGFPVRVLHALGVRTLFVSNAAGGVRRTFVPGDLMIIADHLNLMGRNPLVGPAQPGELRFPDMSDPYDRELRVALRAAARAGRRPGAGGRVRRAPRADVRDAGRGPDAPSGSAPTRSGCRPCPR